MLQRQFCVHVLEPSVFFFQLTQAANVGGFHATILCLPLVVGGVADLVFATNVSDGLARLDGFQDGDDLRLAEFALSHSASWRHTRPETSTFQWPGFWGGLHVLCNYDSQRQTLSYLRPETRVLLTKYLFFCQERTTL